MMDIGDEKNLQGGRGCVAALLIGVLTIGAVSLGQYLLQPLIGFYFREAWGVLLFQSLIVAAPFGLYALTGVGQKSIWITAFILSSFLWGLFAFGALQGDAIGANIGVGFLMMASPLGIAAGAPALVSAIRRLRNK